MDCDFGEFLDSVRGQSSAYCIECYSKEELEMCSDILSEHGYACHVRPSAFDDDDVKCVTIWLYPDAENTEWNDTTYEGYLEWCETHSCADHEIITAIYPFSDFQNPAVSDSVDTGDFDEFLSSL